MYIEPARRSGVSAARIARVRGGLNLQHRLDADTNVHY